MERLIPTTILGKVQEAGSRENSFQPVSVDLYNLTIGGISKTMNSAATDSDHIPCVIVFENDPTIKIDGGNVPMIVVYERREYEREETENSAHSE